MTNPAVDGESSVVVPLNPRERHAPGEELDSAGADSWEAWSTTVAEQVLPMLDDLSSALPGLQSALLSTADGFGLCARGLDDTTVRRVSSMASSMTSLASAATDQAPNPGATPSHTASHAPSHAPSHAASHAASGPAPEGDTSLALVTLVHGASITVVLPVRLVADDLLLSVTVSGPTLGSLLHYAELTSDRIRSALS